MENIPKGYVQTKVGILPQDWKVLRVDSVLQRVKSKVEVEDIEEYQQIGIRSHAKGIFHKELVTGEELGNKSVFWIKENCFIVNIVFAWEHAIAKTTKNEKGMIASHRFPMYEPKDNNVDIDYILYFFKSKRGKHLLSLASPGGAGRNKTLGQKEFAELKIPIPSKKEQKRIVEVLDTINETILKQEELIKYQTIHFKVVMEQLLSGKVRFKNYSGIWESVVLGEITKFYLGLTYTPTYVNKGIPFLSVKDIRGGKISHEKIKYISKKEFENCTDNAKPKKGDILFGRVGTLGNPVIVQEDIPFCIFVSLGYMRVNKKADNNFIKHWMNSIYFKKQVFNQVAGSSQKNLNVGWLKNFKLKLPSIKEQSKIAEVLTLKESEIFLLENELNELKEQKKSLMKKLLTGEVRVKV